MTAAKNPTLYGIPACDTVKKSRLWFDAQGRPCTFHDFKKQGLSAERLDTWLAAMGWEALLNRKGTTWRRLDEATRAAITDASHARALMLAQPSVIKRPVIEWPDGRVSVGMDPAQWQIWAAAALKSAVRPITPPTPMSTTQIDGVTVHTQAKVYFDGKCVSHAITLADGTQKTVGVILPATLSFNTGAPEIMECVAGACEYRLAGSDTWVKSAAGERFAVPANARFDIRVNEIYHYICHFG